MSVTVVIPSLNPDEKLVGTVSALLDAGVSDLVLVDDGSDAAHQAPFDALRDRPGITLLTHPVNRGKGRALKTAFAWIAENRPDTQGVVTADGDGQHSTTDILTLMEAVADSKGQVFLGVRDIRADNMPARSRFGNQATKFFLRLLGGVRVSDTQTGLRAMPADCLQKLIAISGDRYEYEMNMLLELPPCGYSFVEIPVETVYIDNNRGSHFRPVRDSAMIYWKLIRCFLRFAGASMISAGLDLTLFGLFGRLLFDGLAESTQILLSTVLARVFSSTLNFILTRYAVFHSHKRIVSSLWRYYALCMAQMLVSAGAVMGLCAFIPLPQEILKCVVDIVLFFISYRIQRRYVFGEKRK